MTVHRDSKKISMEKKTWIRKAFSVLSDLCYNGKMWIVMTIVGNFVLEEIRTAVYMCQVFSLD